jgi:PD-(D/E)XK nuclease superfamily
MAKKKIVLETQPVSFYRPDRDGVTNSLLVKFRNCRVAARFYLDGWVPKQEGLATTFGSFTHRLFQLVAERQQSGKLTGVPPSGLVRRLITQVADEWRQDRPRAGKEETEWLELTVLLGTALLPLYFTYWKKDATFQWKGVEHTFKEPFIYTSRRTGITFRTFIRGKMDGVLQKVASTILFETKTKSRISPGTTADILSFNLQLRIYLQALILQKQKPSGVLYNIVRRPGLQQKQKETVAQFAARIVEDIQKRPEFYFIRLRLSVTPRDLEQGRMALEELVTDFLAWWAGDTGHYQNDDYCEGKYGVCPYLPVCANKDYSRLYKRKTVFTELEER